MYQLSENSLKILEKRYLLRDANGHITENAEGLFRRVAKAIAAAELKWGTIKEVVYWEKNFYEIMEQLLFLPNSPALMNAGTRTQQLSACFVLPVKDSLEEIFTSLKQAALIQKSGGGTGFNFSHIRPKYDRIDSPGGAASGPLAFMKVFDMATEQVKQGGKRRGANMGILNCDHPDIEEFIVSKVDGRSLKNFNISVGIFDSFMEAVENNSEWNLVHPTTKALVRKVKARDIWNMIITTAWQCGDPGLLFLDSINSRNPLIKLGTIEATNPCGEVPLLPYEPCNLGSANLSLFLKMNNDSLEIDWYHLEKVIHTAIRFLDNMIEVNDYIIPEVAEMAIHNRKIGLGVMGWADLLIQLEIPYDSDKAVRLATQVMQFIEQAALQASQNLAEERGPFTNWPNSIYYPDMPLRNSTRTSIAPTGTISIIADTSSSIEPLFALAFSRHHVLDGESIVSMNPYLVNYLKRRNLYTEKVLSAINKGGIAQHIDVLSEEGKRIFKTALEIEPIWHLRHQLAFQRHTDNAVSKTVNLPESASLIQVEEIYKTAWRQQAKGITIFRQHSKREQVMEPGVDTEEKACNICQTFGSPVKVTSLEKIPSE